MYSVSEWHGHTGNGAMKEKEQSNYGCAFPCSFTFSVLSTGEITLALYFLPVEGKSERVKGLKGLKDRQVKCCTCCPSTRRKSILMLLKLLLVLLTLFQSCLGCCCCCWKKKMMNPRVSKWRENSVENGQWHSVCFNKRNYKEKKESIVNASAYDIILVWVCIFW